MNQNKLSADPISLIFGIIALVLGLTGCCCYGIPAVITLTLSIIGLVLANKSIREYKLNPEAYSAQSRSNVGTGKVLNIIAIIFNGIIVFVILIFFVLYGTLMSTAVLEGIRDGDFNQENYESDVYEWENDTLNTWESDDYNIEEQMDSTEVDIIEIDSLEQN